MQRDTLIARYEHMDVDMLEDFLALLAANVEDALTTAGGEPGRDFDFRYVFDKAVEIHCAHVIAGDESRRRA